MMYNERCSLCGSSVTYCSNTKRASPARDSDELTVRPRSPAARNAFRNQISSLVKSKSTLAAPCANLPNFNCAVFQLRHFTDRSACGRQYFLRGTDLSRFSQGYLNRIARRLNQRPRKTLGFETPADRLQAVLQ